jgi:hypothetical protein
MNRRTLTPILVTLVVLAGAAGYWIVKVRERADAAAVTSHVDKAYPGARVGCVEMQSNGSAWSCAAVYQAEYLCVHASVSVMGSITTGLGKHKCSSQPQLEAMAPHSATAAAVAADVTRIATGPAFTCIQPGSGKSHWVCGRKTGGAIDCRVVSVLAWQPLKLKPAGSACINHKAALGL